MPRIYSTATNHTEYCEWIPKGNDIPVKGRRVLIHGGAGVAQRRSLITPLGVATEVNDMQLAFLKDNALFREHVANGFLTIVESGNPEPDKIAADMEQRDGCAPIVPGDFEDGKEPNSPESEAIAKLSKKKRFVQKQTDGF